MGKKQESKNSLPLSVTRGDKQTRIAAVGAAASKKNDLWGSALFHKLVQLRKESPRALHTFP